MDEWIRRPTEVAVAFKSGNLYCILYGLLHRISITAVTESESISDQKWSRERQQQIYFKRSVVVFDDVPNSTVAARSSTEWRQHSFKKKINRLRRFRRLLFEQS